MQEKPETFSAESKNHSKKTETLFDFLNLNKIQYMLLLLLLQAQILLKIYVNIL